MLFSPRKESFMKKNTLFFLFVSIAFVPAMRGAISPRHWRRPSSGKVALGAGAVGLLALTSYFTYKYFSADKQNKLPDEEMQDYQIIGNLFEGLNSDDYDDNARQQEIALRYQGLAETEKESLQEMFKVGTDELVIEMLHELYPMLIRHLETLKKDNPNKTVSLIGAIGCSGLLIAGLVDALLKEKLHSELDDFFRREFDDIAREM